MKIILLSGGSGKRLWPLSNEARAKQFLKIFKRDDGVSESMVQRMYRMINEVDPNAEITIATSENQVASIHNQLGSNVAISVEPCRRDTFPAIALATAFLKDVRGIDPEEPVVVCPVDPYVEKEYFEMLVKLENKAREGASKLVLMGIRPTYPSAKYGYIFPNGRFKEKPSEELAQEYIRDGALWNGGIFAYKIKYVLEKARALCGTDNYNELLNNYSKLEKISFDYAVAEHEKSIETIEFDGEWKDLGTWNTFTEAMSENCSGEVIVDKSKNVHVVNELDIPLITLGINDAAIVASQDGILVTDKEKSAELKRYVDKIELRPMKERREWGEYKVLEISKAKDSNGSLTKHLVIEAGKSISYQKHFRRDEVWTIIEGEGEIVLDGVRSNVKRGDVIQIRKGTLHAMRAIIELHFIEVQLGDELVEEDIERFSWNWKER